MADNFGSPGQTVLVNMPCSITETPFSSDVEVRFQIGRCFERHIVPRHKCDIERRTIQCTIRLWDGNATLILPNGWMERIDEELAMKFVSDSEEL